MGAIYVPAEAYTALRQCEILTGVEELVMAEPHAVIDQTSLRVGLRTHPYALVVSQDCDLEWDHRARSTGDQQRQIPNVLFCEITTAELLLNRADMNGGVFKRIKQNKDERYQFLEAVPPSDDMVTEGLPELALDFKRYFTVPTGVLYSAIQAGRCSRRCRLSSPYLEQVSTRFAYYLLRVALPEDHRST